MRHPVISLTITGLLLCSISPVFAQVGPPEPKPEPPAPQNKSVEAVKNSFMKLFKKEDGTKVNPDKVEVIEDEEDSGSKTTAKIKLKPAQNQETDEEGGVEKFSGNTDAKAAQPASKGPARPPLLVKPELTDTKIADPVASKDNPPPVKLMSLDSAQNPLGIADATAKLKVATTLVSKKEYTQAKALLLPLKQWLVDLTEAHINLYKTLNNIPTARAQSELEKQVALQFALLRDKTLYQIGVVEIADKNYKSAIKELVEVIKSQPKGEIGIKAYKLLQDIGFTEKLQLIDQ